MIDRRMIVLDLESTGFEVCQIGAVKVDEGFNVLGEFSSLVKPLSSQRNPKAMSIHGISEEALAKALEPAEVLKMFEEWMRIGGDYPDLAAFIPMKGKEDYDFLLLRTLYQAAGCFWPWRFANRLNIAPIAWFVLGFGFGEKVSLEACLKKAGLEFVGKHHNALDDAWNENRLMAELNSRVETIVPV